MLFTYCLADLPREMLETGYCRSCKAIQICGFKLSAFYNTHRTQTPSSSPCSFHTDIGLMGTKLGCSEGGCGACTVMVSHYDNRLKKCVHYSVNACLAPLYSVEGMHIITVEGIGNRKSCLHPIQVIMFYIFHAI